MRIADGNAQALPILFELDGFVHAERMFRWMIANKITGETFVEMVQNQFQHSWLSFGKWVVMRVNKDKEVKKVIAGKDFIPRQG